LSADAPPAASSRPAEYPPPRLEGQDEQAFVLEFPTKPGLAVGYVNAFDDLTG
jgi:hypothetical protein